MLPFDDPGFWLLLSILGGMISRIIIGINRVRAAFKSRPDRFPERIDDSRIGKKKKRKRRGSSTKDDWFESDSPITYTDTYRK